MISETTEDFEKIHHTRYHFDNEEENYHHDMDIYTLSVALSQGLLTYTLEIPFFEKKEGSLQKIIHVPKKVCKV